MFYRILKLCDYNNFGKLMGCCNSSKNEVVFYTTGLNFIEVTREKYYYPLSMDKIIYRHMEQHYKSQESNSQEGEEVEVEMTSFFKIDPDTLKIEDASWAQTIQQMLIHTLIKYRHSIMINIDPLAPIDSSQHKFIGRKYSKREAIAQIDNILRKLNLLFSKRQFQLNSMCDPLWHNLPTVCFELALEHPFLFDLIKSETFDWEVNYLLYKNNPS